MLRRTCMRASHLLPRKSGRQPVVGWLLTSESFTGLPPSLGFNDSVIAHRFVDS